MSASDFTPVVAFPLALRPDGTTKTVGNQSDAVKQLIEELLFTNPGERLNRPDLGCGLMSLMFGPLENELVVATQFQVKAGLQKWLGDVLTVQQVTVASEDSKLEVTVVYQLPDVAGVSTVTFAR